MQSQQALGCNKVGPNYLCRAFAERALCNVAVRRRLRLINGKYISIVVPYLVLLVKADCPVSLQHPSRHSSLADWSAAFVEPSPLSLFSLPLCLHAPSPHSPTLSSPFPPSLRFTAASEPEVAVGRSVLDRPHCGHKGLSTHNEM